MLVLRRRVGEGLVSTAPNGDRIRVEVIDRDEIDAKKAADRPVRKPVCCSTPAGTTQPATGGRP